MEVLKTLSLLIFVNFSLLQGFDQEITIIAKYRVMDEYLSPRVEHCTHEVKPFLEMDSNDCSFYLDSMQFQISEKFALDSIGRLAEYSIYKPMGPLTYSLEELQSDPKLFELIGGNSVKITFEPIKNVVYDSGKQYSIERIFPKERLILATQTEYQKSKGERLIFEYRSISKY